jgi:hypothetical protein
MKIATKKLTGVQLNYAVAIAKGRDGTAKMIALNPHSCLYRPSTDGSIGQSIIEEAWVSFERPSKGQETPLWRAVGDQNEALTKKQRNGFNRVVSAWGETALIACMRCFVLMNIGDEIEIPDSLFN